MAQTIWEAATSPQEVIWVDANGNRVIWSDSKPNLNTFSVGSFPPTSPTSLQNIIPSYLFVEYNDDDTLQAFVSAQNKYAQEYLTFLNSLALGVYTQNPVSGTLLDWVASGVYGTLRPALPSNLTTAKGGYNSTVINTKPGYNGFIKAAYATYYVTSDDTFRRILTWNFYKGDGFIFSVRWLKRRVMRFLFGVNGIDYGVNETYPVSVTFTATRQITISINASQSAISNRALMNAMGFNNRLNGSYNSVKVSSVNYPSIPEAVVFQAAMQAGVLNVPFQYTFTVNP